MNSKAPGKIFKQIGVGTLPSTSTNKKVESLCPVFFGKRFHPLCVATLGSWSQGSFFRSVTPPGEGVAPAGPRGLTRSLVGVEPHLLIPHNGGRSFEALHLSFTVKPNIRCEAYVGCGPMDGVRCAGLAPAHDGRGSRTGAARKRGLMIPEKDCWAQDPSGV